MPCHPPTVVRIACLVALGSGALTSRVEAQAYTRLISFGDSLTDVGNTSSITFGISPGSGYYMGRFSNGPLWAEDMASSLGLPAVVNSRAGGLDYAVGGSHTGAGNTTPYPFINLPNAGAQINQFLASKTFTSDDLVTIWTGANDFLDGQTDPSVPANNVAAHVQALLNAGAKNIVVVNLPPLGETPRYRTTTERTARDAQSTQFNALLASNLNSIAASAPTATLYNIDVAGFFASALANPAAYGLSNVTDPAMNGTGTTPVDQYLFWDDIHPTRAGHALLGGIAFDAVTSRAWNVSAAAGSAGSWTTASDWSQKRVPDSTSNVTIVGGSQAADVTLATNATVRKLAIGGSATNARLTLANARLTVATPAQIVAHGTLAGDGTLAANLNVSGGEISPGASGAVGHLSIEGSLNLDATSKLDVDLAAGGAADRLDVTGSAAFNGAIRVAFVGGYIGLPGTQATVLSYASLSASPATTFVNATGFAGLRFQSSATATALTIQLDATGGDANLDNAVNFTDLLALAQHFGVLSGETWLDGDFNHDGAVQFADLLTLAQHFGGTPQSFAADWALAQSLAPEPSSLALLFATPLMSRRRRASRD